MILYSESKNLFHIQTESCSYMLKILPSGHLTHLYYGKKVRHNDNFENFDREKNLAMGSMTSYDEAKPGFSLNHEMLEYSSSGKGDYRDPSISLTSADGNRTFDFLYDSHTITEGKKPLEGLPSSQAAEDETIYTLEVMLTDQVYNVSLVLSYSTYPDKDIITRNTKIINNSAAIIAIDKVSSVSLDFDHFDFDLITLDGAWIRERHVHRRTLDHGKTEINSRKGVSSPDHNPFLILCDEETTEKHGNSYGFALMYSGNHSCSAEVDTHDNTRVQLGINHFDFVWNLNQGDSFQTPEAVMAFSDRGLNALSLLFHNFIRDNIVRGVWKYKERPILINNWEATYFDFNEKKLLKLAKEAKALGMELFVLDDGWFGKRQDDRSSLGDWTVNYKKLPGGIKGLADKIKKTGLDFGIWVEPEMISKDSDLFRSHPDWLVHSPGRAPSPGRFQFLLDLANKDVCDYIYNSMRDLFNSADISYVKWDMNRNFSDVFSPVLSPESQKEFSHRYILGLYGILERLTKEFPEILFESCASGGSRFDLAMFSYMPQIWTSDNTDAVERLHIQTGSSFLVPTSVMGAHVSAMPNHQVLRNTPIESRFNTAAFGLLGYELDLTKLNNFEKKVIRRQIKFYKKYRKLLQFGDFFRIENPTGNEKCLWLIISKDKEEAILGYYQILAGPNPSSERYPLSGLDQNILYKVENREQFMDIRQFGDLINMILPVSIKENGKIHSTIADNYLYRLEMTEFRAFGDQLMNRGFVPKQQFYGTGLDDSIAYIGDFGSRLFVIKK